MDSGVVVSVYTNNRMLDGVTTGVSRRAPTEKVANEVIRGLGILVQRGARYEVTANGMREAGV